MAKIIPKSVYMRKIDIAKQIRGQRQLLPLQRQVIPRCNCSGHHPLVCLFHSKAGR